MAQRYSRTAEILEIYERHGGLMGIARLARLCLEEGVWSDHERDQMAFSDAKQQCHRALKSKDVSGLPVAGLAARSAGRTNVWKQLPLWDFEDAVFNLGIRIKPSNRPATTPVSLPCAVISTSAGGRRQ